MSALLNMSIDAVQSNNKKYYKYYKRICDYFHQHKIFESEGNANSLMNRWSGINFAVNKFCGYYAQLIEANKVVHRARQRINIMKTPFNQYCINIFGLIMCAH